MRRRVSAAVLGAVGATGLEVALLAAVPWRPRGAVVVVVAVLGLLTPLAAAAGAVASLRLADPADLPSAARLTALGTPFSVLLVLFGINVLAVGSRPGAQQVAAIVLGAGLAAGLAARFTGPEAPAGDD